MVLLVITESMSTLNPAAYYSLEVPRGVAWHQGLGDLACATVGSLPGSHTPSVISNLHPWRLGSFGPTGLAKAQATLAPCRMASLPASLSQQLINDNTTIEQHTTGRGGGSMWRNVNFSQSSQ